MKRAEQLAADAYAWVQAQPLEVQDEIAATREPYRQILIKSYAPVEDGTQLWDDTIEALDRLYIE